MLSFAKVFSRLSYFNTCLGNVLVSKNGNTNEIFWHNETLCAKGCKWIVKSPSFYWPVTKWYRNFYNTMAYKYLLNVYSSLSLSLSPLLVRKGNLNKLQKSWESVLEFENYLKQFKTWRHREGKNTFIKRI